MDPVAQQRGEIEQRIAPCALVPVDNSPRREVVGVQDHVVQLEVVVQQAWRPIRHDVALQPAADIVVEAVRTQLHRRQAALAPACNAAGHEALRPAEIVQPDGLGVHGMDRGDGFQQHLRQPRADVRTMRQLGRQMLADHQPGRYSMIWNRWPITVGSSHRCSPRGDERQRVRQARQDAEFACHVVGAGRQLPHRRSAQHGRLAVDVDQVVQVGQPAGELARRRVGVQAVTMTGQVDADRVPVQENTLGGGPQANFG